MHNEFTAIVEQDGDLFIAYCPEISGANGQGRTKDESLRNLAETIDLILEDRREDALRGIPDDAIREQSNKSYIFFFQHGNELEMIGHHALMVAPDRSP